jgi:hypothetical protein
MITVPELASSMAAMSFDQRGLAGTGVTGNEHQPAAVDGKRTSRSAQTRRGSALVDVTESNHGRWLAAIGAGTACPATHE